jgi:hypothetical protein
MITLIVAPGMARAQDMQLPRQVEAGKAFSIPTSGSGNATVYIVGLGQAIQREVSLGSPVSVPSGMLYAAGQYLVLLVNGSSRQTGTLLVVPQSQPHKLAFLAAPSRLPVDQPQGISGTVYVFDAYHNLITTALPVSFQLTDGSGGKQQLTTTASNGVAWTRMNSSGKEGNAIFLASAGNVSTRRVIDEVPGEPCSLSISAHTDGKALHLQTAPVADCSGNPVPDGTIVTFTERSEAGISTVDVPVKKGIASIDMPAIAGATFSVASGTMIGNEIHWAGGQQ